MMSGFMLAGAVLFALGAATVNSCMLEVVHSCFQNVIRSANSLKEVNCTFYHRFKGCYRQPDCTDYETASAASKAYLDASGVYLPKELFLALMASWRQVCLPSNCRKRARDDWCHETMNANDQKTDWAMMDEVALINHRVLRGMLMPTAACHHVKRILLEWNKFRKAKCGFYQPDCYCSEVLGEINRWCNFHCDRFLAASARNHTVDFYSRRDAAAVCQSMSKVGTQGRRQTSTKLSATKALLLQEFHHRVRDNVRALRDNFTEILRMCRVHEEGQVDRLTEYEFALYDMQVRATNMVRCAEVLIQTVSDLRQFLVLNDFAFINEAVAFTSSQCQLAKKEMQDKLSSVKEEIAVCLLEAEQEYYNTTLKNSLPLQPPSVSSSSSSSPN